MRIAVDTGGTFTDLIVEEDGGEGAGRLRLFKAATHPDDPTVGIFEALGTAAERLEVPLDALLGRCDLFIHATTRAINAILTGTTARTAYLATQGHRDTLLFREGGRIDIFDFTVPYPDPYVPRALTYEVPERIGPDGEVISPLDEAAVVEIAAKLKKEQIEAVGVCLLWSTVNPRHELRVGELLDEHLPGIPATLSHQLNPTLREYRRASSTCIDASLKPVVSGDFHSLEGRLRDSAFAGRFLAVTSQGGVKDGAEVARAPIHLLNSGPSMAPVAGRFFARADAGRDTAIVVDTGGTSFDVSLVRDGRIPWTRETWLGEPFRGHMTGFPSIDVKSIGAGGGSIAWVDEGGLLHVGPRSAGAVPGPACYGHGGRHATVTDAALVIGLLDPAYFLGGRMALDAAAARDALERDVAKLLGSDVETAAVAVMELVTENMVQAIEGLTVHQGIDPASAVLVAGGGAAGLNVVAIARRLGCTEVVVPRVGAVLSAAGALMSDLGDDFAATFPTTTESFDREAVNEVLESLEGRCREFSEGPGRGALDHQVTFIAEARYPHQVWEIEIPLHAPRFASPEDVARLVEDFHSQHERIFAISDPGSEIEIVHWHARVRCRLRPDEAPKVEDEGGAAAPGGTRRVVFPGAGPDAGPAEAAVLGFESLRPGQSQAGPAIVESPFTSIAIEPGMAFEATETGSLRIRLSAAAEE